MPFEFEDTPQSGSSKLLPPIMGPIRFSFATLSFWMRIVVIGVANSLRFRQAGPAPARVRCGSVSRGRRKRQFPDHC